MNSYEYVGNDSLNRLLFGENQAIEWGKQQKTAIGTAKGFAYLHGACLFSVIYNLRMFFLTSFLPPKLADFGLAKLCNRDSSHITMMAFRGTAAYAAPEIPKRYPVTCKCDVCK